MLDLVGVLAVGLLGSQPLSFVAIDHAVLSDGLDVIGRCVGGLPGRDHRALVLGVARRCGAGHE